MSKIGIIAAMQEEKDEIKNIMENITYKNIYDLEFIEGIIGKKDIVLVESRVGKVNAARTTQILIDNYDIESIINVGSAGSAINELNIGDIVIGGILVQHDFDITAFGHKKGYISNVGEKVESSKKLLKEFEMLIKENLEDEYKIKIGIIASGDIFCTEPKMKEKIHVKFNADAIEMEGAAIAQVCCLSKVPFLIIRSISDSPNNNNNITFEKYLELASKRCAKILQKYCNK